MNGQSEQTIQTLKDMLTVCILDFLGSWAHKVALMEFVYNNSYHQSLKCLHMKRFMAGSINRQFTSDAGERKFLAP